MTVAVVHTHLLYDLTFSFPVMESEHFSETETSAKTQVSRRETRQNIRNIFKHAFSV